MVQISSEMLYGITGMTHYIEFAWFYVTFYFSHSIIQCKLWAYQLLYIFIYYHHINVKFYSTFLATIQMYVFCIIVCYLYTLYYIYLILATCIPMCALVLFIHSVMFLWVFVIVIISALPLHCTMVLLLKRL